MADDKVERPQDIRADIWAALNAEERVGKIGQLIDSAFELKRLADAYCPDCKRRVRAEIPDVRGTVAVLVDLMEQGGGKPGTADVEKSGVTLVVERNWPKDSLDDPYLPRLVESLDDGTTDSVELPAAS